ncbi:MAG TPA: AAA family ATPase [Gemmatimonadaceae bacterium]|jgi:diguanylate cyclase (GGDEF)-like protein|nr:AAA family ATPase [Gemmatimonadaceae bacterium]
MQELLEVVSAGLAEANAAARPVSVVSIELDRLAALRESLGAPNADQVCEQIARMLQRLLRTGDYVQRVSDGELLVVLLGAGARDARQVAGRLGAAVRGHEFAGAARARSAGAGPKVTISAGVAAAPDHAREPEPLVSAARQARMAVMGRGGDGVGIAGGAAAPLAAELQPDVNRFAGRLAERRALVRTLDEAVSGRPRIVSIVGEVGSGTMALARQLEPEVRMLGGSMVYGHGRSAAVRSPYGHWAGVLGTMRRIDPPSDSAWHELPKLVRTMSAGAPAPSGSKYRLMEEIALFLRTAAGKWPLVVVLDEMQWADEQSWDTLQHVAEQLTNEQLLICLTMRTGAEFSDAADRRSRLRGLAGYQEFLLSRLTREEVKRWLEAALYHQEVGRELLAFVYRHTQGNPFLLTQVVRGLLEDGSLWSDGTQWHWRAVSELRVPPGMDGIVAERLARFPAATRAVLSTAAVIGGEFDVALLEASGAGGTRVVEAAVEEAMVAGVVQYTYERRRKAFVFAHQSMAEALLQSQSVDALRDLHARVAAALERRGEGTAAEIAQHYDAAGLADEAYRTALRAAAEAEGVYALRTAGDFLHMASRNAASPGDLAGVRLRMAQLADTLGRYDEAEELCDLALDWFEGQGDRRHTLTLRRMRERARTELGQPARHSLEALRAMDAEATELGFAGERVAVLLLLSQAHGRLGETREAARIAAQCVEMAEPLDDPLLLAEALTRFGITVETESPERARECYERALRLARAAGDIRTQVTCRIHLGMVLQAQSQMPAARESLSTAIAVARAAGMVDLWAAAALNLGLIFQKVGDVDRAGTLFGEALGLSASLKNTEHQLHALFNMANTERERGAHGKAREYYESTAALAQRVGQLDLEIGARAGEGLCQLALGRAEDARRTLAEAERLLATRSEWFQGRELLEALRVKVAADEQRHADVLALYESARSLGDPADLYGVAWLTAACAPALFAADPAVARAAVDRYAPRAAALGFAALTAKFQALRP